LQPVTAIPTRPVEPSPAAKRSYGQILKSSALIGGSSVLNIGFGIIRTKAMALLLGPQGVGLFGLYNSVYDLVRNLAGMGINNSGVRQIAEAVGSQDSKRIARTVTTLRRVAFGTGALGGLVLLAFCKPLSWQTFGDYQHVGALALLALAVLMADISSGQAALIQGMRRIADLARMNVLGALYGTVFSLPIIYYYRQQGIVPSLVVVAAMSILTSWWYARKIKVEPVALSLREVMGETSALLRMGFVFMASGLMTLGVAYLVRVIVARRLSMQDAGFYQAAWGLGGFYFATILQAMGADFYPRLTAVAQDDAECNRLVNEQTEIGLLLGGPGVLGTLTLAPLVIDLFYSLRFGPAAEVLRWLCLGMMLRVIAWPMGFILVAKGKANLFFWTELLSNVLHVLLIWAGVLFFGLQGTGIAFFSLYVLYTVGIYLVVARVSQFRWSAATRRLGLVFLGVVAVVFGLGYLPARLRFLAGSLGLLITLLTGLYSMHELCALIPADKLPPALRRILSRLPFLR
jgi:enterobacterial common antigen flippase